MVEKYKNNQVAQAWLDHAEQARAGDLTAKNSVEAAWLNHAKRTRNLMGAASADEKDSKQEEISCDESQSIPIDNRVMTLQEKMLTLNKATGGILNIDLGVAGMKKDGVDGQFGALTQRAVIAMQAYLYPGELEKATVLVEQEFLSDIDQRLNELSL